MIRVACTFQSFSSEEIVELGPVQTSNFSCAEPNVGIKYMESSTYESIKIDIFEFGSTLPFYPTGPVDKNGKMSTAIQTSNFSCAESNA